MNIYLVQHGKPVPKEENPDRPLSEQGIEDIERIAAFLNRASRIQVEEIFHSGKTRARQTAEILSSNLISGKEPLEKAGLAPLDDVRIISDEIMQMQNDFMIVGHLPHLARLTSLLTTGSESNSVIGFQQGGIVCLRYNDEEKVWTVAWMLVPEIIM
jgi:phosphohistidine phosphatase